MTWNHIEAFSYLFVKVLLSLGREGEIPEKHKVE